MDSVRRDGVSIKWWIGKAGWLLALLSVGVSAAQPMRFARLGLDEGLSQLAVNAIAQDATGFMWFGTEEGLDRYDGYGFHPLRHDRKDPRSLRNDFIFDIEFDQAGALWVATDGGGVVRYDPTSGDFSAPAVPDVESLKRARVLRFDRAGRLWIGSRDAGVAMLDLRSRRLLRFRHDAGNPRSLSDDSVFALLPDRSGAMWIGTEAGVDRLQPGGAIEPILAGSGRVRALLADRAGLIWAGSAQGVVPLSGQRSGSTAFKFPQVQVNALLEDRHGYLWAGTDDGLALFDRAHGMLEIYRHDSADPASLPDNQVMSLAEDRSGLLWVGTKFGGIAKWNPRTWSFGRHLASNVMAFTKDKAGRLWIGSIGGGLTLLDPATQTSRRIEHLSDDRVMALLADREGGIWAGTMRGGLNRIDAQTLKVTVFQLAVPGVMSLLEDSAGRIWVGTFGDGLARYERATGQFIRYPADAADPTRLESGRVTALAQDGHGRIWAGTDGGGLHVFDPASGRFFRLPHNGDPGTLSSDTVYALHIGADGTVWVGTRGGGLDQVIGSSLDPASVRFRNLSLRDGLPNDTVYGIRADRAGALWLATNRGLARLDPRSGAIRAFHRDDGLQSEEFNFGAHYADAAGRLFFGGPDGYNAFDPARLEFNRVAPPLVLTQVSRLGKPFNGALRLQASDSAISFEFAALDFTAPRANLFQYRLEGLDRGWSAATAQRSVSYSNLDGGHYTLRVRAANADGVWNEAGLAVALDVSPPAWKSAWACAGYVAALALLSWLMWRAHRRSIEREVRYSHELEAEVRRRTLELERVSHSDALTGLGNRRALIRAMPQILAESRQGRLALMVIDLDNLKPINDEHGHEGGDRVLAGVAAALREELRETDRIVRWGGDEFVIVRAGVDLTQAAEFAERVRARLASQRFVLADGTPTRTTCSIGFALYPFVAGRAAFLSWEQVLHLADIALYRAKARRNAWFGWSGKAAAAAARDLTAVLAAEMSSLEDNYVESRASANVFADQMLNAAI